MGSGFPLQVPSTLVDHFGAQMGNTTHVVHVAAVSCGSNISGVLNLIKSAALFNNEGFVHFHVFSDAFSEGALQSQVCSNDCVCMDVYFSVLVHQCVGPSVCWSISVLVHQHVGPSACWSISVLVHQHVGPSACWCISVCGCVWVWWVRV